MADTEGAQTAPVSEAGGAGDPSPTETESATQQVETESSQNTNPDSAEGVPDTYTPGPNAIDLTEEKNGGLLKEIIKEGTGEFTPSPGDTVIVHYVGTLTNGTQFDSSRDRGDPFDFEIGKGKVIQGWDQGVLTMKPGEVARFICRSDYAYGDQGQPPTIPPKATLIFEVELFEFKGEDLSPGKDEGICRSRIEKGEGFESPNDGATCEVHLKGTFEGRVFEDRDVSFVVSEGSEAGVVPGVEEALKKFLRGEKSLLKIKSKYAYGQVGCTEHNIPAGADLTYEVTLKTFEKAKESWEMDGAEKLEQAALVKDRGTKFFKDGKYELAQQYYQKIVSLLETEDSLEGEDAEKKKTLLLAGHLNTAMCHLKTGYNLEAMHQSEKALELDKDNEKGLFRRATAHMNMKSYEEAVNDFQRVLDIDPANKAAKNQLAVASHNIRLQKEKEKQLYGGMFTRFAELDAKKQPPPEVIKDGEEKMENGGQEDPAVEAEGMTEEVPMDDTTAVA